MSNDTSASDEPLSNRDADSAGAISSSDAALPAGAIAASFQDAYALAYRKFYQKLEAAWHSVDIRQTLAEAEFELQCKLASFVGPGQELERCEATADYLRLVQHLNSAERQRTKIAFAFERYVDEVQAIWRRSDIHAIDPREISRFGESIAWAAYYASMRPSG
jgi:hypothetical protein